MILNPQITKTKFILLNFQKFIKRFLSKYFSL